MCDRAKIMELTFKIVLSQSEERFDGTERSSEEEFD